MKFERKRGENKGSQMGQTAKKFKINKNWGKNEILGEQDKKQKMSLIQRYFFCLIINFFDDKTT